MKRQTISKRLVSFATALVMMLSLWTVNVMAEDTVTFESIANGQLANYVVSNLTLGEGWTSSNPDVITNDGVVSRSLASDNAVTLTHTSGATFNVTVPAQTTVVHAQSDFYAPTALNDNAATLALLQGDGIGGFTRGAVTNDTSVVTADTDGNQYLKIDYTAGSTQAKTSFDVTDDVVYISGKIDGVPEGAGIDIRFQVSYGNTTMWVPAMRIAVAGTICNGKGSSLGIGSVGSGFRDFCIKVDLENGKFYLGSSKDNMKTTVYALASSSPWNSTDYTKNKTNYPDISVTGFRFQRAASSYSSGTIYIDDFVVTTDVDENEAIASLPDAERVSYFKGLIENSTITTEKRYNITSDLDLDAGYAGYDLEACDVSITWTSENPAIAADGTVTRKAINSQYGKIYATVTAGEETAIVPYHFTVPASGTSYVSAQPILSSDFEDKTVGTTQEFVTTGNQTWRGTSGATMTYEADTEGRGTVAKLKTTTGDQNMLAYHGYGGTENSRYVFGADVKFERDDKTATGGFYYKVNGVSYIAGVTMDYKNERVNILTKRSATNNYRMPEELKGTEGQWVHIEFDANLMSRTFDTYINGIKIASIPTPSEFMYNGAVSSPLRGLTFGTTGAGTLYVDNMYALIYSSADVVKANAAVNAIAADYGYEGKIVSGSEEYRETTFVIPTAGPVNQDTFSDDFVKNNSDPNILGYVYSGGATVTKFVADGVECTPGEKYIPTHAGQKIITVTAESGSASETLSFVADCAPAKVTYTKDNNTVSEIQITDGEILNGKILLVGYLADGSLYKIEEYEPAATIDTSGSEISLSGGMSIKIFYVDDYNNITPLSLSDGFTY